MDNAKEFLQGDMAQEMSLRGIQMNPSPPYSPNKSPAERYIRTITERARSLLFLSGLEPARYWSDAISASTEIQNVLASATDPTSPMEKAIGHRPDISGFRLFGCLALSYVEKDKRHKFDPKFERCINLGPSPMHSHLTYALLILQTETVIYRRHVVFNEGIFPRRSATTISRPLPPANRDTATAFDLLGKKFRLDGKKKGKLCTVLSISNSSGSPCIDYQTDDGAEYFSTIPEVLSWVNTFELIQAAIHTADIDLPESRAFSMNQLAYACYLQVMVAGQKVRKQKYGEEIPNSYKDASNMETAWFQAEAKEDLGILSFDTWQRISQTEVTPLMWSRALRAHRIYDIKRPPTMRKKNRLVVNGARQHRSTYTDTTCPVASLLETRILAAVTCVRGYRSCTGDSKNAYLHAGAGDFLLIIIPEGFPGAGEAAILRKALYGTKQGARRYYDLVYSTLLSLGLVQCTLCPCLFRFTIVNPATDSLEACFILVYSDDNMISGEDFAFTTLRDLLATRFEITFEECADFLGTDLSYDHAAGTFEISMKTFTDKFLVSVGIFKPHPYPVFTPGLTNMKIIRSDDAPRAPTPDPL